MTEHPVPQATGVSGVFAGSAYDCAYAAVPPASSSAAHRIGLHDRFTFSPPSLEHMRNGLAGDKRCARSCISRGQRNLL